MADFSTCQVFELPNLIQIKTDLIRANKECSRRKLLNSAKWAAELSSAVDASVDYQQILLLQEPKMNGSYVIFTGLLKMMSDADKFGCPPDHLENEHLKTLKIELSKKYIMKELDGFCLYLYGIVLKKLDLLKEALEMLVEAVNYEPLHWGAWLELAVLIPDKETLLSLSLPNHWMKNLFLGHMYLELQLNEEALKIYQGLVDGGFSKSTYIVSQMAVVYHNMREIDMSVTAFAELQELDPYRLENMDTYSNLLYIKGSLREKAKFFATNLGIAENAFECSSGWLEQFKGLHNIAFKKICGESKSVQENSDEMNEWKNRLSNLLNDYSPDQIYNADEPGLFFLLLPDKTLEFKDVKCSGGKQSKERLTALVCENMSGNDKLPILVIGKSKNPHCFKNVKSLPSECVANKKAWMTSEFFINWLHQVDKQMTKRKRHIVMIVDNCPAHPHVPGLKSIKLVFLPPNTTSVTQPMDQGVIRNLKLHYRKLVIKKQITAIDTKTEFTTTILDGIHMLNHAWSKATQTTIANCYHHAGFESPIIAPSDDINDDVDDDIPLALLCRIGLPNGTSIEDYTSVDDNLTTSAQMTDTDIIEDIISSRSATDDQSDPEDEPVPPPRHSMSSVFAAFNTLNAHLETVQNSNSTMSHLNFVNSFVMKHHLHSLCVKQSDISVFFQKAELSKQD
ncbi:Cell division cycle protein 23 homolog [Mytilus coruscus]|uniref:Cell division cycle protein 23 homolog n=1 Tax=Mytilus coruscus TaxID=42192 RepID=A0A6J8B065_MYTCO|nr:Cell division cycle protein 23 homolog [Mytilus coruscus]